MEFSQLTVMPRPAGANCPVINHPVNWSPPRGIRCEEELDIFAGRFRSKPNDHGDSSLVADATCLHRHKVAFVEIELIAGFRGGILSRESIPEFSQIRSPIASSSVTSPLGRSDGNVERGSLRISMLLYLIMSSDLL